MKSLRLYLCLMLVAQMTLAASLAHAQSARGPSATAAKVDETLRSWLIQNLERRDPLHDSDQASDDATAQFAHATVRLVDSAPPMDLVYLTGHAWCGTGGCTTLVIDRSSGTPRIVSYISITRPPISVLPTQNKGWHDIRALSYGGGQVVADWETFRFNGTDYEEFQHNPVRKGEKSGQVVFTDATPLHYLYRCRRKTVGANLRDCKVPKFVRPK